MVKYGNAASAVHGFNVFKIPVAGKDRREGFHDGPGFPGPAAPLAGAVLALLLQRGMVALGVPFMTAPFIVACLLVLLGERLLRPRRLNAPA